MNLNLLSLIFIGLFSASVSATVVDHPTEILVALKKGVSFDKMNLTFYNSFQKLDSEAEHRGGIYKLELPQALESSQYIKELNEKDEVLWAEANPVFVGDPREYAPNDPEYSKQFHHKIIQSEKAWDFSTGKEEVVVAVTDDGFLLGHEDLSAIYYRNPNEVPDNNIDDDGNGYVDDVIGWNFNEGTNNPGVSGRHGGHGTHVAGIVAGDFDNGKGIVGHGPKIRVMPLKFYGKQSWTGEMIMQAYKYATDNGAKIITTSYNVDGMIRKKIYQEAITYAYKKGLIIFNSAGNGNMEQSTRTKETKLLLVASTQSGADTSSHDLRSRFSNYGYGVDVAAPGNPIYSTSKNGKYVGMSGTSMAAPNAAGVAALIWSVHPEFSREMVLAVMMMATDDVDTLNPRYKYKLGNGRINSFRALSDAIDSPAVRQGWYTKANRTLNIQIKGILDKSTFTRGGIILEDSKGRLIEGAVVAINKYEVGTNILKYQISAETQPGGYRMRMLSNSFKGPFSQPIDGDQDGNAGGEFVLDFEIE